MTGTRSDSYHRLQRCCVTLVSAFQPWNAGSLSEVNDGSAVFCVKYDLNASQPAAVLCFCLAPPLQVTAATARISLACPRRPRSPRRLVVPLCRLRRLTTKTNTTRLLRGHISGRFSWVRSSSVSFSLGDAMSQISDAGLRPLCPQVTWTACRVQRGSPSCRRSCRRSGSTT